MKGYRLLNYFLTFKIIKMKKTTLICTLLAVLVFCMACSKELEYSCDPKINEWVAQNKDAYAEISRTQLATFDIEKQQGLFRSFAPKQRSRIFHEKYDYLMGLDDLSAQEKEQLAKLYQLVTPEIYTTEINKKAFNEFAAVWVEETKQLLGWGDTEIFLYTHTWLTLEEVKKRIETLKTSTKFRTDDDPPHGDVPNCMCYYSVYCIFSAKGFECVDGNCNVVDGCGVVGTSNCTGLCD